MGEVAKNMVRGVKWTAFSAVAGKVVSFILGIVLARLLTPEDFGVVGMTTVFMALISVVADGGLCVALVRKQNLTEQDKSTIFIFNVSVTFICFLAIVVLSRHISKFLNVPMLENIIKTMAFAMLVGSFAGVHWAMCQRNVDFKKPAIIDLIVQVITGIVAIMLAYKGYGAWALAIQSVCTSIMRTVIIWQVFRWKPSFEFSWKSFKELFAFGGNLTINTFLSIGEDNVNIL